MHGEFSDLKLTYNSMLYLDIIASMNGTCTATQIADLLYVSRPAVTKKIRELMKNGFIFRTEDPLDARKYYLSINEEKLAIFDKYKKLDKMAIERITESYDEDDIAKFCEMLDMYTTFNSERSTLVQ